MPGLDGTGPKGRGPMTGAGEGYCIVVLGDRKKEIANLKDRARTMQKQLKKINIRIKELEKSIAVK